MNLCVRTYLGFRKSFWALLYYSQELRFRPTPVSSRQADEDGNENEQGLEMDANPGYETES